MTTKLSNRATLAGALALLGATACDLDPGLAPESAKPEPAAASAEEIGNDPVEAVRDSLGNPLGPVTNRIVAANRAASEAHHLLARVEVQPNEIIEFYEPTEGVIVLRGAGAPEGPAVFPPESIRDLPSIQAAWAKAVRSVISPTEEMLAMPRALQEAVTRMDLRMKALSAADRGQQLASQSKLPRPEATLRPAQNVLPGAIAPLADSGGGTGKEGGEAGFCQNRYFTGGWGNCASGWDFKVCLNNHRNGAFGDSGGVVHFLYTNVCPTQGNVRMHNMFGHPGWGDDNFTVLQDTVGWADAYAYRNPWCFWCTNDYFAVRTQIEQATGDTFHFRFYLSWSNNN